MRDNPKPVSHTGQSFSGLSSQRKEGGTSGEGPGRVWQRPWHSNSLLYVAVVPGNPFRSLDFDILSVIQWGAPYPKWLSLGKQSLRENVKLSGESTPSASLRDGGPCYLSISAFDVIGALPSSLGVEPGTRCPA